METALWAISCDIIFLLSHRQLEPVGNAVPIGTKLEKIRNDRAADYIYKKL
jgi:hypothetical protein